MSRLTEEQLAIVNDTSTTKRVDAVPGAGKTTVLLEVVKHNKEKRHLLLCFNASIKEEIKHKVKTQGITNVEVFTFHGLAYNFFRRAGFRVIKDFGKRRLIDEFDYFFTKDRLKEYGVKDPSPSFVMGFKNFFEAFMNSNKDFKEFFKDCDDKDLYMRFFNEIKDDTNMPITHSFYIKVFEMIKFKSDSFDSVLVDECQDMSPCYFSIVKNLKANTELYVGDSYQKIYGYNGAIGIDERMGKPLPMSVSFRVGYDIAYFCNSLIWRFFKQNDFQMKGNNKEQKIVKDLPEKEKYAIITRTNLGLLKRLHTEATGGKACFIVGGKEALGIDSIRAAYTASDKNPFWYLGKIRVTEFSRIKELYQLTEDDSLKKILSFVDTFKDCTLEVLEEIERSIVTDQNLADVFFTTTHKSKGLEFENVEIGEDFPDVYELYNKHKKGEEVSDEIYILYVAISRSCKHIKLNPNLMRWYNQAKERKRAVRNDSK